MKRMLQQHQLSKGSRIPLHSLQIKYSGFSRPFRGTQLQISLDPEFYTEYWNLIDYKFTERKYTSATSFCIDVLVIHVSNYKKKKKKLVYLTSSLIVKLSCCCQSSFKSCNNLLRNIFMENRFITYLICIHLMPKHLMLNWSLQHQHSLHLQHTL